MMANRFRRLVACGGDVCSNRRFLRQIVSLDDAMASLTSGKSMSVTSVTKTKFEGQRVTYGTNVTRLSIIHSRYPPSPRHRHHHPFQRQQGFLSTAQEATNSSPSTTSPPSLVRPFIGKWILQPDQCRYEYGIVPDSGSYLMEALTDLSDEDDTADDNDVNHNNTSQMHELRFVLKWTDKETGEKFQSELSETLDGMWHIFYSSGGSEDLVADEICLRMEEEFYTVDQDNLQRHPSSSKPDVDSTTKGRSILVSSGRLAGRLVWTTRREIIANTNQLKVTQKFFLPPNQTTELENVSYFVRDQEEN